MLHTIAAHETVFNHVDTAVQAQGYKAARSPIALPLDHAYKHNGSILDVRPRTRKNSDLFRFERAFGEKLFTARFLYSLFPDFHPSPSVVLNANVSQSWQLEALLDAAIDITTQMQAKYLLLMEPSRFVREQKKRAVTLQTLKDLVQDGRLVAYKHPACTVPDYYYIGFLLPDGLDRQNT